MGENIMITLTKSGITILISDRADFETIEVIMDKHGYYYMIIKCQLSNKTQQFLMGVLTTKHQNM
jgi:hypothetical protein